MAGQLSDTPEAGADLEDYVAALFQTAGYFVEKNLTERDPSEVLELDIVATDYSTTSPKSILAEAKGGGWGYHDIFKVVGWMQYLNLPLGALFVRTATDKDVDNIATRCAPLNMRVVHLGDFTDAVSTFADAGFAAAGSPELIWLWRHSFLIERKLTRLLVDRAKSLKDSKGARRALDHQRLVNDGIFFAPTPIDKVRTLYETFQQTPKLTLSAAVEMQTGTFDSQAQSGSNSLLQEAMWKGDHPFLQGCMFVEHRARLSILKCAVDYCCANPDGPPEFAAKEGGISWAALDFHSLPHSFTSGVEWLRKCPTFHRYGVFWQQFLWGWGGFYLEHRQAEEFEWMAAYSGVPVEEVPTALQAFDRFFPMDGGWLTTVGPTTVKVTRMAPMLFEGVGVFHRRQQYELADSTVPLGGDGYTASDLARWNNVAAAFLNS